MQHNNLYELFAQVLNITKGKALRDSDLFVSVLLDLSRGKLEQLELLQNILCGCVVSDFAQLNGINEKAIDIQSKITTEKLCDRYHLSQDYATEVAYSMGAAVKNHYEIPFDVTAIIPKVKTETSPPKNLNKRFIAIALVSVLVLSAVIGFLFYSKDSNLAMNDHLDTTTSEDVRDGNLNIDDDYMKIISQYERFAALNYDPDEYERLLQEDYYNYCYIPHNLATTNIYVKSPKFEYICYSILDINQDGIDELIITDDSGGIWDLFTIGESGPITLIGYYYSDNMSFDEAVEIREPREGYMYSTDIGMRYSVHIGNNRHIYGIGINGPRPGFFEYSLPEKSTELYIIRGTTWFNSEYKMFFDNNDGVPCSEETSNQISDEIRTYVDNHEMKLSITPIG